METIERTSALATRTIEARVTLDESGQSLHWSLFSPYTDEEIEETDRKRLGWPTYAIRGTGILTGRPYLVPAEAVFPAWRAYYATSLDYPESDGVGIAAGFSAGRWATIERALREVLEREGMMLSWRVEKWNRCPLSSTIAPVNLRKWIQHQGLELKLYDVGDSRLCSVVLAIVSTPGGDHVTVGGSCQDNLCSAAAKATLEAIMLRESAFVQSTRLGLLTGNEIADSAGHVAWAWQNGWLVCDWYNKAASTRPRTQQRIGLRDLAIRSSKVHGYEPIVVNITDPRLSSTDFEVLRVLVPNAYKKEYRHCRPFLGGQRLRRLEIKPADMNCLPHPIG